MPTFPCKLLVHGKPCNYGDKCNYSHDDALVKRFQQAECPHGKGCAFKDVGSGCIYGRHNLPAPTSQDTVREDEEIAHAQDAVRGDHGHAGNAWFLDTCCTAGVFKTPQLAPSHPPDSRVFFATSNDMTSFSCTYETGGTLLEVEADVALIPPLTEDCPALATTKMEVRDYSALVQDLNSTASRQ